MEGFRRSERSGKGMTGFDAGTVTGGKKFQETTGLGVSFLPQSSGCSTVPSISTQLHAKHHPCSIFSPGAQESSLF